MPLVVRQLVALLAGVVSAVVVVSLSDAVVGRAFPLPVGTDLHDAASMRAAMEAMPAAAMLMLVAGWALAAGIGAYAAVRLAPGRAVLLGASVVAILLVATIANLFALPHPAWLWPASLVAIPAAGWIGARMGAGGSRGP